MTFPYCYFGCNYGFVDLGWVSFNWYNADEVGPGASYKTFRSPFEPGVEYCLDMTAEGWFLTVMVDGDLIRRTNLRRFWR